MYDTGCRLTQEQRDSIAPRYIAGESLQQIATSLNCYKTAVLRWLEIAGVKRRPPGRPRIGQHRASPRPRRTPRVRINGELV